MKLINLLFYILLLAFSASLQAQNIFTFGNSIVSKQEFNRAFLKNSNEQLGSAKLYRDYLELYIRFKLKVKAAYDLKLDTLPNQKAELKDFSRQIEEGFLNDDSSFLQLVNEAFQRSRKDIHLAHIFIALDSAGPSNVAKPASPDTARAWKTATTVYNELAQGTDFGQLASKYSSDPSALNNKGDIGFITLFTLPYELENLAYSIPPGKFSKPYRSSAGYHIFKNLEERKAAGKIKAAQILFAFPPESDNKLKTGIKQKADSVYNALMQGASFTEMVDLFSNDINGPATHGELPEFGVGSYDAQFEALVFALDKNGAVSKPIPTPVGYYIIKRLDHSRVNEDASNDSALTILKQQVRNDLRMEVSRRIMLQKMYKITGFKKSPVKEDLFLSYAQNALSGKNRVNQSGITDKTAVFKFPHQTVYAGDFIKYLKAGKYSVNGKSYQALLHQYEDLTVREYYRNHLAEYNPEYAAQVKEFKEGNLLFEIMQRNIWDKAAADSAGLLAYYESNKNKYWWEASADAIIFSSADSGILRNVRTRLELNSGNWRSSLTPYENIIQADSGRFEFTQLPLRQLVIPTAGMLTEPIKLPGDNNTSFVSVIRLYPGKQQRNFEDAKGFVLNDYQAYLENKWIAMLKMKYPVKINEAVFRSIVP